MFQSNKERVKELIRLIARLLFAIVRIKKKYHSIGYKLDEAKGQESDRSFSPMTLLFQVIENVHGTARCTFSHSSFDFRELSGLTVAIFPLILV